MAGRINSTLKAAAEAAARLEEEDEAAERTAAEVANAKAGALAAEDAAASATRASKESLHASIAAAAAAAKANEAVRRGSMSAALPRRSTRRRIGARELRNESCSELYSLPAPVQVAALSHLSVVQLWRARRVSQHFHRWATEALDGLPQLVSVGGATVSNCLTIMCPVSGAISREPVILAVADVQVLSLATMRWAVCGGGIRRSHLGAPPGSPEPPGPLPVPRKYHALVAFSGGRLVAAGGTNSDFQYVDDVLHLQAVQWVPGSAAWTNLPDNLMLRTSGPVAVALPDGRMLLAGGAGGDDVPTASAEVLAADGSGWEGVAPMRCARTDAVAGLLPSGCVIVAGGTDEDEFGDDLDLASAEQWDPATNRWTVLPSMSVPRAGSAACVLPDGRFAVVGGHVDGGDFRVDGEVFDPVARLWEPLGHLPQGGSYCRHGRTSYSVVAVAGGMVAVGGDCGEERSYNELFDEESDRWLALPHPMVVRCDAQARVVSVPASALAPPLPAAP